MKIFATSLSLMLTFSLASSWELKTSNEKFEGTRTMRCQTFNRNKDNYYVWERDSLPPASPKNPDSQAPCCVHLYTDVYCESSTYERQCEPRAGFAKVDIKGFTVRGC